MGESDRYIDNKHRYKRNSFLLGQQGNALFTLFTLNIIFFLLLLTIQVAYYFYQQKPVQFNNEIIQWFQLPASLTKLSERPWTILTQMFCHIGIMEILSNMLWLWAFGFIFQEMTGNKKLIPVYIYGGLAGSLFFILSYHFIPALKPAISTASLHTAGASTMAIAVAATTLAPNYRFFRNINGGIPIWVLLIIYIVIDVISLFGTNLAFSLAHAGGGLAGFLFIYFLRKGKDGSMWMNNSYNWLIHLFDPDKKKSKSAMKEKVFYETGNRKPYQKKSNVTQQRIDEILDKINSHGYHLLTDEEKNILKRASEE